MPEERLHQRIHAGHNCWVLPEEKQFLTGRLIEATCMVGTRDQLLERLHALEAAGLGEIMILPAFAPRYQVLEQVGTQPISALD